MNCPVCGDPLNEERPALNALSRVLDEYICSPCGGREAMFNMRGARGHTLDRRVCLHSDEASGIMLVVEDEPGYEPFGRRPRGNGWAEKYCRAWNRAVGLSDNDVDDIVTSSMFGRWAHF